MKLNHLHLTVDDVLAARRFLRLAAVALITIDIILLIALTA